ncbi:hypothetical protein E2C01_012097 [Portunus trituberculatus]|uniref:Uncharacterized protein n=1 Tax=Portunus trituberculatus TaxID=210409 RepID=A0A5B7DD83_PORTR|nr:hypothetical protein [Portunus trituberculatus]
MALMRGTGQQRCTSFKVRKEKRKHVPAENKESSRFLLLPPASGFSSNTPLGLPVIFVPPGVTCRLEYPPLSDLTLSPACRQIYSGNVTSRPGCVLIPESYLAKHSPRLPRNAILTFFCFRFYSGVSHGNTGLRHKVIAPLPTTTTTIASSIATIIITTFPPISSTYMSLFSIHISPFSSHL